MHNKNTITDYICNKYYYVLYNHYSETKPIVGLLLNYASGNIVLLIDDGVYHIKYKDILFMKPIKNLFLEKCSEEFKKLIQSLNTEE